MNWRRAMIAVAVVAPVIGLLGYGMTQDPKFIPSPLPGKTAPRFALSVFSPGQPPNDRPIGDTVRLDGLGGQVVVLNFWASWCLECRVEHQTLSEIATEYRPRGAHFYGVLYNDVEPFGRRWIEEMGGQSYPSLADPHSRTSIDYGVYGVPETFFVGKDGRVAYKHIGPIPAAVLKSKLDSLLAVPASP